MGHDKLKWPDYAYLIACAAIVAWIVAYVLTHDHHNHPHKRQRSVTGRVQLISVVTGAACRNTPQGTSVATADRLVE